MGFVMAINWKLMDAKLQWADEGRLLVELPTAKFVLRSYHGH